MNNREALQALLDGKKIRKDDWKIGKYLRLTVNGIILDEKNRECSEGLNVDSYSWEVVKKPKNTVKMAPTLLKSISDGYLYLGEIFFVSEEFAKARHCHTFVKWLIDTPYAIDVEVDE